MWVMGVKLHMGGKLKPPLPRNFNPFFVTLPFTMLSIYPTTFCIKGHGREAKISHFHPFVNLPPLIR